MTHGHHPTRWAWNVEKTPHTSHIKPVSPSHTVGLEIMLIGLGILTLKIGHHPTQWAWNYGKLEISQVKVHVSIPHGGLGTERCKELHKRRLAGLSVSIPRGGLGTR